MSLSCFSQVDTAKNKAVSDTTKVVLTQSVAKLVVKDLIRYDGCVEELKLTQDKVELLEDKIYKKDSVIQLLTLKDSNNQSIILLKNEQLKTSQDLSNSLKKELKSKKVESIFYKIGTFIAIVSTSILIATWH